MMEKKMMRHCQQSLLLLLVVLILSSHVGCCDQQAESFILDINQALAEGNNNSSHIYRTNICDRQAQLSNSSIELRDALQGLDLKIAIRQYPTERRLFALDDEGRIPQHDPGLFVELLDELARRAGFTWRNSFVAINSLTGHKDWTWSDVLEYEITHFDVSMDLWYQTNDRRARGTSFPHGWFVGGIVMGRDDAILIESQSSFAYNAHFWPFEPSVWVLLVAFTILNGIVFFMVEHVYLEDARSQLMNDPVSESIRYGLFQQSGRSFHVSARSLHSSSRDVSRRRLAIYADYDDNDNDDDDDSFQLSSSTPHARNNIDQTEMIAASQKLDLLVYSIFLSTLSAMGTYSFEPISGTTRVLCFSLSFWALIMTSAYTANLASAFVFRRTRTNLVDLNDAINTGTPICVLRSSPIPELILKDYPEAILVRKETEEEMFTSLRDPFETDYAGRLVGCGVNLSPLPDVEQFQVQKDYNPSCTVTTNRRQVLPFLSGMATTIDTSIYCTSLISYVLDLHIREMQADGTIGRFWVKHLEALSTNNCGVGANGEEGTSAFLSSQSTVRPMDSNGRIHINQFSDMDSLNFQDMAGIFVTHWAVSIAVLLVNYIRFRRREATALP